MKVYLACALTYVPRSKFEPYVEFLHSVAESIGKIDGIEDVKYALVNSDPQLADKPANEQASLCYAWDRKMVEEADLIVAECSFPSTGLGIELQIAESSGIPIIMMIGNFGHSASPAHYQNPDRSEHDLQIGQGKVSLMALGIPAIKKIMEYHSNVDGIKKIVEEVKIFVPN